MGLALIAASAVHTYPWLLFWLMIYGIGYSAVTPAGSHAIIFFFKKADRGLAMGLRQCGVPLAGVLGSLALPAIALRFDYGWALAAAGIVTIIVCAGASFYYREPAELQGEHESLRAMFAALLRMPELCDPYIYFHRVRPYIFGWKDQPALPDGVFLSRAETDIGGGSFEFAPVPAHLAGAVFFQPVTPRERGNARVAMFAQNGSVSVGMLDVAPSALGEALDGIHLGDVSLRYWDAASTLVSREIVGGNTTPPRPVAMPLSTAVDASLGTREVMCGGRRWVIFVIRSAGANRLYAEPAACVVR